MNPNEFERSDWYAPAHRAPAPPQPQPKKRKPHTALKVVSLSLCAVLLLVASVYAFSDAFGVRWFSRRGDGGQSHSFTFEIPGPGSGPAAEKEPAEETPDDASDGYAEDFREFFRQYYTQTEPAEDEDSKLARYAAPDAFRLSLQDAEGRQALTLQELYASCADTVVGIRSLEKGTMGYYWGSGIVMRADGYILTNQHLIAGTDKAVVILSDGTEHDALLVGEDAQMDLAVLKIEADGLHAAEFGNSAALTVGDDVVAIGNPLSDSLSRTMTNGIISAIDRSVNLRSRSMTLLQTTAAINEGSSGGALFNLYGQVVGVTFMKLQNPYSDVVVEGLGFAIPSATVKAVTDQLIATGKYVRPGIGITVGAVMPEDAAHYGLPGGLYISSVSPASDAAKKGVQEGDILTHVNGIPVRKTDDVLAIRDTMSIGDIMTLTVFRDGETLEIGIELYNLNDLY